MPLVRFQNVSKTYQVGPVAVKALDEVDLSIEEGEFVAIAGPSGSGKSTLMHLLGFLDQPSAGQIFFDGRELSSISPNERATIRSEKIGFVFQAFNLLPRLTVLHNTLLPLSYARTPAAATSGHRVQEILDQVGMGARAGHRPSQLSGGEKQRVAIARALINQPRIILADEPTGNLDSRTAKSIMEVFTSLNKEGRTVIVVTHDSDIADYGHRRIQVLDGKIVSA
jgi:ABC-type lipoprotein export system ATPase subunit